MFRFLLGVALVSALALPAVAQEKLKVGIIGLDTSHAIAFTKELNSEKAEADVKEFGWDFTVGYGLTQEQMRTLGLYISEPRSPQETDRPFAEPAVFLVRPDNRVQIVDIANAPFARADLEQILGGLKWIQDNDYPVRGTLE